jgi:predicted phage replisome organizer
MADVKWIKITTDIFDDEKILLIESLPDSYAIITVWFKLLCLAGKQNNSGVFMMGRIPYTDKMLATIFRMKESTVTMALGTFEQFGMIELIDGVITIPNWGKHQNLDQIESKKEYMRNYMKGYREKQRALTSGEIGGKTNGKTNSKTNVRQADKDIEIEEDKEIELDNKKKIEKEIRHKYGEYENVLLSDSDFEKLKAEFPSDYNARIENLSSYIASTGKTYKNHLATIRNWARQEKEKAPQAKKPRYSNFDVNEAFQAALRRTEAEMHISENSKTAAEDETIRAKMEALKERLGQ